MSIRLKAAKINGGGNGIRAAMTSQSRRLKIMVTIIVKCVGCGTKKEIKPGEVASNDVPMCSKCFMPMVAVKAKSR